MYENLQLIDTYLRDSENSSPISESFPRQDISFNFDTNTNLLNVTEATEIIEGDISLMYSRLKFSKLHHLFLSYINFFI